MLPVDSSNTGPATQKHAILETANPHSPDILYHPPERCCVLPSDDNFAHTICMSLAGNESVVVEEQKPSQRSQKRHVQLSENMGVHARMVVFAAWKNGAKAWSACKSTMFAGT